ncbi:glutamine--fructose-6-phosphate transaminase (isomerizing) [Candidatus Microgenomates bacterium]|nr:glutamine--fructose-6-phosphate transaminase (isomerizing) [Candidatus Microgenomates bacterium]
MCGIFGYIGKQNNAAQIVLTGLKKLEYRGYDSWGIGVEKKDKLIIQKKTGKIGEADISKLPKSNFGFGHTRWATHGGVTDINSHPHLDCAGKIAVIHNGIIENYVEIKKELLKKGHKFRSQTDSEVAAHLIEEERKKRNFREAVRQAFNQFQGLNAIIAMEAGSKTFIAVKTGSPLVLGFGKDENFLASDAPALLAHTRKVHFLEDEQLAEISTQEIKVFQAQTGKKILPKIQTLDWKIEEVELGKFPYFMIKEIFEQPKILRGIAENSLAQIPDLAKLIKKAYGVYAIGCGTASYACLAATYLFSKIAEYHLNYTVGSEFGYTADFLTSESLVMAFSQSGETIDIIESVKEAKKKKAKILAITNVLGSTLYRAADYKMLLTAGPEKAVASTKAFTSKLALIILLAHSLAGKIMKGKELLEQAGLASQRILKKTSLSKIKKLANKIFKQKHIYIIGRGLSYPIALEAAMKIKEISYIHAEGFAAGELKHGVIALIEKGTPCLVFAPKDETFGAVLSGAMEVKARGGYIIGVSPQNHEVFDYHLPVVDCGEATMIPNTVVAQLLAYYLALKKGFDPDKPRNLAKSVTVK